MGCERGRVGGQGAMWRVCPVAGVWSRDGRFLSLWVTLGPGRSLAFPILTNLPISRLGIRTMYPAVTPTVWRAGSDTC